VVIAHSKGLPFVLVAAAGLYDSRFPYAKLVVKPDSPLKTASDLNGKVFAAAAVTDQTTIGAKAWIDQHGGDSSTLKILEFPFSATADAVASGRVDFGAIADPGLQAAVDAGKVRPFANFFDAIALQFMNTAWFTTTAYLAGNRGTVEAFARSIEEATRFVTSHPGETVSALATFTGVEPMQIGKTHRMEYAPGLDPRLIQPVINVCAKYKVIPSAFDAKELLAPEHLSSSQ
jgi:ABC-type nitrate/sulfonate/bicarbonate transport system substrate-binding protein